MADPLLNQLETTLLGGDMDKAVELVRGHVKEAPPGRALLARRHSGTQLERARLAGAVAEVLAHLGRNVEARDWLKPWTTDDDRIELPATLPARVRLQAAEHEYARRRFDASVEVARGVLQQCERQRDAWGAGEAAYYLARSSMRLHQVDQVYRYCDVAVERFSGAKEVHPNAVQWRTGLTLLVSGFTGWQAGHEGALLKLVTSRTLLAQTGDRLAQAHAEHSIGSVYRSMQGDTHFERAHSAFRRAREIYEQAENAIHLTRVLINIGRTHFDAGEWDEARRHLDLALARADRIQDDQARKRHTAETRVYMSWLAAYGSPRDMKRAEELALEALNEARGLAQAITVEALLVYGSCLAASGRTRDASSSFEEALRIATRLKIAKLIAHAELCLADLFSSSGRTDLSRAIEHWRSAEQLLTSVSSRYLRQKADLIGATLRDRRQVWMMTRDQLLSAPQSGNKFRQFRESLERWIVDRLEEEKHLSQRERARRMGVTPSGYLQKKKDRKARSPFE
jgi:tetratricopeptide (TPR) repeat protein